MTLQRATNLTSDRMADYEEMHRFLGGDNIASRAANALLRSGVHTVEQLARVADYEITDIRFLGAKGQERIREKVAHAAVTQQPGQIDKARIARYLGYLADRAQGKSTGKPEALNTVERDHVAAELSRLATWYTEQERAPGD